MSLLAESLDRCKTTGSQGYTKHLTSIKRRYPHRRLRPRIRLPSPIHHPGALRCWTLCSNWRHRPSRYSIRRVVAQPLYFHVRLATFVDIITIRRLTSDGLRRGKRRRACRLDNYTSEEDGDGSELHVETCLL